MEKRYKIVLTGNRVYKEIELTPEKAQVKVGTGLDCDIRLRKELFFAPVALRFTQENGDWTAYCEDPLYLSAGDVRKLLTKPLRHGDTLAVKYQESDITVFTLQFWIDFDQGEHYARRIDLAGAGRVSIGFAPGNDIMLKSEYVQNDAVCLSRRGDGYVIEVQRMAYGVFCNGKLAHTGDLLRERDFLYIADFFFYYQNGALWTQIRPGLFIDRLHYTDALPQAEYPKFHRNTRIKTALCTEKIEILDPPPIPQKPKNNLFTRLLPSLGMLLASGVMAFFGGAMIIMSAISGVMAVVTSVLSIREGKKEYQQKVAERQEKYSAYIERKRGQIEQCRLQELQELEEIYTSPQEEIERYAAFSSALFDRTPEDADFLCLCLGCGDVASQREIDYKKQERLEIEDDLQALPEQLYKEYQCVHDAPIICDCKKINALGIVGTLDCRFGLLRNLVLDLAARQYDTDLKLFFIAESCHAPQVQWLRYLPHAYNDTLGIWNIACSGEGKSQLFEYLYKELTARAQTKAVSPHFVVFLYDECGFQSHPIAKFVAQAKELGVTFVFFADTAARIPQGCGDLITLGDGQHAVLHDTEDKQAQLPFRYRAVPQDQAEKIVQMLAPVYTEEVSLEGTLTKNISLFSLLHILSVEDIDLEKNWGTSHVYQSMAAPIGVSKTGVVTLDLHDKAHGPHGLVAGTTGSGKSEILQTYILSMATLFHPYEVGFVIIDFKGGGMVNQFKGLPHLLGAITNIDGNAINRSLKSIKAELQKRQRLFAEADVNHIDKYIRKYKAGQVKSPLPHLVIIVDEFAELKAEQPEFMKELISAARIGRSLGVHLILATQKPSGQVNEQIWSNSRFKLCLKVQSQSDSNEVLRSPLAAEIKEPGRAYLQVGNNEIFELFQSAYSGAPECTDDTNVREFTIYQLTEQGKRVPVYTQKKQRTEGSVTQLDAIVRYVTDHCTQINLPKLPDICLPELPEVIAFHGSKVKSGVGVSVGMYDAPEMQYQGEVCLKFMQSNAIVIGAPQTGKTNLLQTIVRAVASQYTPKEAVIYIADFGSMVLQNFDSLHHVGGVVCANDPEKVKNLFKLLSNEVQRRKQLLADAGVSSFASYLESGRKDLPQIILLIDNIGLLRELYLMDTDPLLPICREGLSVGISVIATNGQTTGIGYKYLSNFDVKIAFQCNDTADYTTLFGNSKLQPYNIPGRCMICMDKEVLESQIYRAFEGEKEFQRVAELETFVTQSNAQNQSARAKRIPTIPEILSAQYIAAEYGAGPQGTWTFGVDYNSVTPVRLAFAKTATLGVVCPREDENRNILNGLFQSLWAEEAEVYIADDISGELAAYQAHVKEYRKLAPQYLELVQHLVDEMASRYERVMSEGDACLQKMPQVALVANGAAFVETISGDRKALEMFKLLIGKYRIVHFCFVLTGIENAKVPIMGAEVLKAVKENGTLIVAESLQNLKVLDVGLSASRQFKGERKKDDVFFFSNNKVQRVRIIHFAQPVQV